MASQTETSDSAADTAQPLRLSPGLFKGLAVALFAIFCAFLWLGSSGDLWFDEIYSLSAALTAKSSVHIPFLAHDNNHIINTLWLRLCGEQTFLRIYRGLSIACGIVSFFLVGWIARTGWGSTTSLIVLMLFSFSYPLILYFTEARGYAGAVLCSLLAYKLYIDMLGKRPDIRVVGFWFVCLVGLAFHPTFLYVPLGLAAATLVTSVAQRDRRSPFASWAALSVPLVLGGFWYLGVWRSTIVAGGPPFSLTQVAKDFAGYASGLPVSGPFGWLTLILVTSGLAAAMVQSFKQNDYFLEIFILILLIVPASYVLFSNPDYVHFRYFLVVLPFILLLAGKLLACLQRSQATFFVALALLLLYCAANSARISRLAEVGRGAYSEALAFIWQGSGSGTTTISADHDGRAALLVAFYSPPPVGEKSIQYLPTGPAYDYQSEWVLLHSQDVREVCPPTFSSKSGATYSLQREFPFEGVSGWRWAIYRRQG